MLALEGRALKTAADLEFDATTNRFQRTEPLLQCAYIRDTPGAKVEIDLGAVGDDVRARAPIDDIGVDGNAVTRIVPFFDASNLSSEFVNSVDAPFRVETGVGGTAVNHDFGFTDALAGGLDQSARTEGRLEDEDSIAAAGIFLNELAGGFAANLFVGGPEKDETLGDGSVQLLQSLQSKERLDNAGFHVEGAGAVGFSADDAEGHLGKSAGRVDRVVVAEDKDLRAWRSGVRSPDGADMIPAVFLLNHLDKSSPEKPFVGEEASAAVRVIFLKAGRFDESELTQSVHHPR